MTFRCVFVDVETTGLNPLKDQIIQYCLRVWDNGKLGARCSAYVLPDVDVPPEVAALNGYDETAWKQRRARPFDAEHAVEIANVLRAGAVETPKGPRTTLAGHNVRFDESFLREAFKDVSVELPPLDYHVVDTAALAMPLVAIGELSKVSLKHVVEHFGVTSRKWHDAEYDVAMAIVAWEKLLERYVLSGGEQ